MSSFPPNSLTPSTGRVLLIGWDAADWKIITPMLERGEMPHLQRLMRRGVSGDLLTLRPVLSPMLWNSIATGHRPERHGVHGFTEIDPVTGAVRPVTSLSRKCKALWNMVTQSGGRAHVANWYASWPAEPIRGICVSESLARQTDQTLSPPQPGAVHPRERTEELAALRMGLHEVDEATMRLFVPLLHLADQRREGERLTDLARLIAESFTVHKMASRLVRDHPWNLTAVYYPGIDHFCHGFMNFHPPRMADVSDHDFKLYQHVIAAAYRLHDAFLGRLIQLAGPDTTVMLVSDHGFHSGGLRRREVDDDNPVAAAQHHREHGILVMAGPGLQEGTRVHGAGLLDVTPTVLALLGLPVGQDMPGRVLAEAFKAVPDTGRIPSWELVSEGDDGRHPPGTVAASAGDDLVLEQFAALGYLDAGEMQGSMGPEACRRENDWNLAQSLLDSGRLTEGFEIVLRLCERWPERADFAVSLAQVLKRFGYAAKASELVESVISINPESPAAVFLRGVAALDTRRYDEGLELLRSVRADFDDHAEMHLRRAAALVRAGIASEAEAAFTRAVEIDPHDPMAWMGLARCAARQRRWARAEECALEATRLDFHRPMAHAILGAVRLRTGRREEADLSLELACRQAPGWAYPLKLRAFLWKHDAEKSAALRAEFAAAQQQQELIRDHLRNFLTDDHRAALKRIQEAYRAAAAITTEATASSTQAESHSASRSRSKPVIIVSGLPRSGTSLVMQMLQAAGLPILTDGARAADDDNPEGYLEWEPVKLLPRRPDLMDQAAGKVVKIISPLLRHLPRSHRYRIILLDRPVDEIIASQERMRQHRGEAASPDPDGLRQALLKLHHESLDLLRRTPEVEFIEAPFPGLIADPAHWAARLAAFLSQPDHAVPAMASAVRPALYRNRPALLATP